MALSYIFTDFVCNRRCSEKARPLKVGKNAPMARYTKTTKMSIKRTHAQERRHTVIRGNISIEIFVHMYIHARA